MDICCKLLFRMG